jgi:hypothetical protein
LEIEKYQARRELELPTRPNPAIWRSTKPQADAYSTTSTPGNNLQPLVDELGYLRADIAALEMRESALKTRSLHWARGVTRGVISE